MYKDKNFSRASLLEESFDLKLPIGCLKYFRREDPGIALQVMK
jgi:hypothetical protein